jgi:predicted CoA-binding protein
MMKTTREDIEDFLAQKRLAMVGVARNPKDFSRGLFRDLCRRGYDMVAVNPMMSELDGQQCYSRVQDIAPPVDGALLMTPPAVTPDIVRHCLAAGITRVWMHRGGGTGAVSQEAIDFCREKGMRVVAGYCPYMFLPTTPFFHRVHGFFMKLSGGYPQVAAQ